MILLGLGANLASPEFGVPPESLEAALAALERQQIHIPRRSRWYRSAPVPISDQPWYVNGVAVIETALMPRDLLTCLQSIEMRFGRVRGERNAARVLDLDILAYDEQVTAPGDPAPELPHPRLHQRAFVLRPLAEVAPGWRHPRLHRTVESLLAALPPDQNAEPIA